jgi:hypothetical protein
MDASGGGERGGGGSRTWGGGRGGAVWDSPPQGASRDGVAAAAAAVATGAGAEAAAAPLGDPPTDSTAPWRGVGTRAGDDPAVSRGTTSPLPPAAPPPAPTPRSLRSLWPPRSLGGPTPPPPPPPPPTAPFRDVDSDVDRDRGLCSRLPEPPERRGCPIPRAPPRPSLEATLVLGLPVEVLPTAVEADVEGLMRGMGARRWDRRPDTDRPGPADDDAAAAVGASSGTGVPRDLLTRVRTSEASRDHT